MEEYIESGGLRLPAAWLKCTAAATFKPDEALVRVRAVEDEELPFLVDRQLVNPHDLPRGREVEGQVKVILMGKEDGTAKVEVPGEALSYGPRILVSGEQLIGG